MTINKNKYTVLSIENSYVWSWSFGLIALKDVMDYDFIRIKRIPACRIPIDLVKYFDITLLQNLDTIKQIQSDYKKVIARIGGMVIDDKNKADRHNLALNKVGAVIATNNQLYEIGKTVNGKTFLIPNGVDLDLFYPKEKSPYQKDQRENFTVGFAGNIWGPGQIYKGWNYYSKAIDRLIGEVDHYEVLFDYNQLEHDDMPEKFFHKIDCLILPSKGEGCSNITMEALACGVPVLTTKVGFHGEMLKNGVDCLFIERNVADIVEKVLKLRGSKKLQETLSKNGREFAEKNHDIRMIARMYDQVFKTVLNNTRRKVNREANERLAENKRLKSKKKRRRKINKFDGKSRVK